MESFRNKITNNDILVSDKANTFIENNVWFELNNKEREFLANMSVFSSFNLKQCMKL